MCVANEHEQKKKSKDYFASRYNVWFKDFLQQRRKVRIASMHSIA